MNRLNQDDLTAGATEGGGKQTKLLAALLVWQASISSGCFPKLCPISFSKSLSGGGSWKAGRHLILHLQCVWRAEVQVTKQEEHD